MYAATTRAADKNETVKIGLPGGKVDGNETPIEALKRESEEEGWLITSEVRGPIYERFLGGGKLIWWFETKDLVKLEDYKEKGRISNIEVTMEALAESGYGNEFLKARIKTKNGEQLQ